MGDDLGSIPSFLLEKGIPNEIQAFLSSSPKPHLSVGIFASGERFATDDNVYYLGSISKVITSLLVLKTLNEHHIDIHANINEFLGLKAGYYPTVYQCLTHTARAYIPITAKLVL